jgi:hypothetical protein
MKKPDVWIGLAEVRQQPGAGILLDRNGAIVNVLALAQDEAAFRDAVETALRNLGFELVLLENAEPLQERLNKYQVADDLLKLGDEVRASGTPMFGTFHTWVSNNE